MMSRKIKDIKSSLDLSFSLAKANFKTRNEGSYLGILWYLLDPLLFFLVILMISSYITGSRAPDYPLYLIIGLVLYNFFSKTTTNSVRAIRNNPNFVTSMKLPLVALVFSGVLTFLFGHFFEIILLIFFVIFFKASLLGVFLYFFVLIFFLVFISGLSLILATLGTYISDFDNIWAFFIHLLRFATPVFFIFQPGTLLYNLNLFNPLFHFINITRGLIMNLQLPHFLIITTLIFGSIFSLVLGLFIFNKYKNKFAELV